MSSETVSPTPEASLRQRRQPLNLATPRRLSPLKPLKLEEFDNFIDEKTEKFRGQTDTHSLITDGVSEKTPDGTLPVAEDRASVLDVFWMELTRGYSLHNDEARYMEKRNKVYAFMQVPKELERFLFFGFLQCLDAFCYVFTILPIRCVVTLLASLFRVRRWTHANTCDFLKVMIIVTASAFMHLVDTSRLYHMVRGQGVIKLYIVYNMLEVADKLCSSFGQDILDALMWTASEVGGKRKLLSTALHLAAAIAYAFSHALLVLLQATTLNVAFNSQGQSLLTILMSNNFVELKGAVFKKFGKPNLFQMSCSDVRERFHIMVLLIFVILRNMTANHWRIDHLNELLPDLLLVVLCEVMIDALKHAFITKFNDINAEVYQDFTITLAFDVARSRDDNAFSDFADQVSRRMGFIPIPISIMLIRAIWQSIDFTSPLATTFIVTTWLLLLAIKIVNGYYLYGKSNARIAEYKLLQRQEEYNFYRRKMLSHKSKSAPNSPKLSILDFPDVLTQSNKIGAGFTFSDIAPHFDEVRLKMASLSPHDDSPTPRRSFSMVNFHNVDAEVAKSDGVPATILEADEKSTAEDSHEGGPISAPTPKERSQQSPSRRQSPARRKQTLLQTPSTPARECESLEEVQAFQLLDSEPVQEIRS